MEIGYVLANEQDIKNVNDVFPRTREKAVDMFPQTKGGNSATMTYFLSCRAMWSHVEACCLLGRLSNHMKEYFDIVDKEAANGK